MRRGEGSAMGLSITDHTGEFERELRRQIRLGLMECGAHGEGIAEGLCPASAPHCTLYCIHLVFAGQRRQRKLYRILTPYDIAVISSFLRLIFRSQIGVLCGGHAVWSGLIFSLTSDATGGVA